MTNWEHEDQDNSFSLKKFEDMLKTDKVYFFDSDEFESIVLHYIDSGKIILAKRALKFALEQHPHSIKLRLIEVELYIVDGQMEKAQELLSDLKQLAPRDQEIDIQQASIYSKKGFHQKAIEILNQALEYTDDSSELYTMIGIEYMYLEAFEKAKQCFISSLEDCKDEYANLCNVVHCFDMLEQHHQAIEFLNNYIDDNTFSEIAWHQLGKEYVRINKLDEAIKAFDYAILLDEYFYGAHIEKAKALQLNHQYKDAIQSYSKVYELDDSAVFSFYHIGICYEKLFEFDLAEDSYLKALSNSPNYTDCWYALIDLKINQHQYRTALNYTEQAIRNTDDTDKQLWRRYACINYLLNDYANAALGCKRIIDLDEVDLDIYLLSADINLILQKYDYVKVILEKANEKLDFYSPEINYRLAGVYYLMDDDSKMIELLEQTLYHDVEGIQVFKDLFPEAAQMKEVKVLIGQYSRL
ncbi:MAG: hypothetical protein Q4B43_04625 [Bacteroidota bacterium]|nr:hypothetical protein [Bacteroidota bacterium]